MLKETAQKQMIEAMKLGDKELKNILAALVTALKYKEADLRGKELSKEEEIEVLSKLIHQAEDGVRYTPPERSEAIVRFRRELKVYKQFLPKQLTEDEIENIIKDVIEKLGIIGTASRKDKGRIMKELIPLTKGKADGKLVNQMVDSVLI